MHRALHCIRTPVTGKPKWPSSLRNKSISCFEDLELVSLERSSYENVCLDLASGLGLTEPATTSLSLVITLGISGSGAHFRGKPTKNAIIRRKPSNVVEFGSAFVSIRIRIQLFISMRIRIQGTKPIRSANSYLLSD
jgi:hypothetical protein